MFLLTFSTAVKYVLSLMLAVLGIIPYDDVKSLTEEPAVGALPAEMAREKPLRAMGMKNAGNDLMSSSGPATNGLLTYIPSRNEFADCLAGDKCISSAAKEHVFPFEAVVEITTDPETILKYIPVTSGNIEVKDLSRVFIIRGGS